MGLYPSKDEILYQQVSYGNVQGIRHLHRDGAGLEWVDREGKTPLIVACMMPNGLPVVKTLLELGANVNVYRPGSHNGTPLHHAAKRGHEQVVELLLLHGANPFKMNDSCQTALDIARYKGFCSVVRTIESRIALFSGWLRLRSSVPNILESLIPTLVTKKIWAVVLPSGHHSLTVPAKLELAMYSDLQGSQPYAVVPLWKAKIDEPNCNEVDPTVVICDKKARYKLFSANEGDKLQLIHFYDACRGIPQQSSPAPVHVPATPPSPVPATSALAPVPVTPPIPSRPPLATPTVVPPSTSEDDDLKLAINASIKTAIEEGVPISETELAAISSNSSGFCGSEKLNYNGSIASEAGPSTSAHAVHSVNNTCSSIAHAVPSAPPAEEAFAYGPIHYPSIDSTPVSLAYPADGDNKPSSCDDQKGSVGSSGSCVVCLDAAVEGACIPCGHMAGCMSCLNEIKAKNWGCPVCRAKIDQVVKLYAV